MKKELTYEKAMQRLENIVEGFEQNSLELDQLTAQLAEAQPAAVKENTLTALAFDNLAQRVVEETERRNREMPATQIVEMKK